MIDAKGDVHPCAHSANLPEWQLGHVDDADGDLVGLAKNNSIIQQFQNRLVEQIPETKVCPWRHFCEGGCAVNAYQHHGGILAPDSRCSFYELMYPRLFERLAEDHREFQRLLDLNIGRGRVEVIFFDLVNEAGRADPARPAKYSVIAGAGARQNQRRYHTPLESPGTVTAGCQRIGGTNAAD